MDRNSEGADAAHYPARAQAHFWRARFPSEDTRWKARFALLVTLSAALLLINPFGLSGAAREHSRQIAKRLFSPWYTVPPAESVSVVLIGRRALHDRESGVNTPQAEWPPSRDYQEKVLREILELCPAGVFIDILYDSKRPGSKAFPEFLRSILGTRQDATSACPKHLPTPVYFADVLESDGQRALLAELINAARGEWRAPDTLSSKARLMKLLAGGSKEDTLRAAQERREQRRVAFGEYPLGLATVEWNRNHQKEYSSYDPKQYYHLLSYRADGTARASLALVAYLEDCTRVPNCDEKLKTFVSDQFKTVGRSRQPLPIGSEDADGVDMEAHFKQPVDILWRRWNSEQNKLLWRVRKSDTGETCNDSTGELTASRKILETLRLAKFAFLGNSQIARGRERSRCYPLPTAPSVGLVSSDPAYRATMASTISGKYVFVGLDDPGDRVNSPIHGPIPGVFLHAMTFDNLMRYRGRYRVAPSRSFTVPGIADFGWKTVVDLVSIVITSLLVVLLARRWNRSAFAHRQWARLLDGVGARGGCPSLLHSAGALALQSIPRLGAIAALVIIPALLSLVCWLAFRWSGSNWIGIGTVSALPVLLGQRMHHETAARVPLQQTKGDSL